MLKPLYLPRPDQPMRLAGFMSGSGTNLVKILERQADLGRTAEGSPYEVVVVFTDNPSSNAARIADSHGLPLAVEDILAFYRSRGHATKKDLSLRPEFDQRVLDALGPYRADAIVLAGYMSVVTAPLLAAFGGRIVNVHPADLRILEGGRRKYTGDYAVRDAILAGGDYAVRDAILAGEEVLRATTHIVRAEVDGGEILMVSAPVPVELPEGLDKDRPPWPENRDLWNRIASEHQERLKQIGDWVILPKTLEWLARGRYALDEQGQTYLDEQPYRNLEAP
jgi:folate-dependent phosphoribosylglycinamide formyltransferase PurN